MPRPADPATRTASQRAAEARRAVIAAGGRRLSIHLSPLAAAALAKLRQHYGTDTAAIEAAIERAVR